MRRASALALAVAGVGLAAMCVGLLTGGDTGPHFGAEEAAHKESLMTR